MLILSTQMIVSAYGLGFIRLSDAFVFPGPESPIIDILHE